jgi:glutamyl-tRNA synthetase
VETEELAQRTGWLQGLIDLLKVRSRTVDELAWQALPFVREEVEYEEKAVAKHWGRDPAAVTARLRALRERLAEVAWEAEPLETELRALAGELGVGAGKLIHPLRLAVTGRGTSPGIFRVLTTLGRERALARLDAGLTRVAQLDRRGSEGAGLS